VADSADTRDAVLLAPIELTGRGFYLTVGLLSLLILWGAIAYWTQFDEGLGSRASTSRSPGGSTSPTSSSSSGSATRAR
jgi:hypothetical protein